jgi:DNA-binding response OmpR family regulator
LSARTKKIVVVEDDPQILNLVQTLLASEGYQVTATAEPTEAVELVRRVQPDLVVCDIAMPVLDGYGVLKALQSDPETAGFPVVFLTAHREFSERVRAFRFGVVDYLTKPFSRAILLGKIERVLAGLERRSGKVYIDGEQPLEVLLDEIQKQARSGILTVGSPRGEVRLVLKAGEVVSGVAPRGVGLRGRFEEVDASREDVLAHDPPALPPTESPLPSFEVPEMVRDVLVVDDNGAFRKFVGKMLESQGFRVHEARDGESGLEAALRHRPWLILTDVRMPGMDGFEFCRRVREHSLLRQIPLLFLSGWDDYKARYQGLELGADDFLSKGTPFRELLIRIQLLMKRYGQLRSREGRDAGGMEGDVQVIGAPGILQMCHLGRVTGTLAAVDGDRKVQIRYRDGEVLDGAGHEGRAAVWNFLAWEHGRFTFRPGDPGPGDATAERFDSLLLEGCRKLDEQRRDAAAGTAAPEQP